MQLKLYIDYNNDSSPSADSNVYNKYLYLIEKQLYSVAAEEW